MTEIDILEQAAAWRKERRGVALATVVETWGSSPRPIGSQMVIAEDGRFEGSVSGGCVEAAVIRDALEVIGDGTSRLLTFGVANEEAWAVGLTCGGTLEIFVERVE